jgi:NAD(P)-dependent dehydrogenase (short-subunit alcohol dehydrogenase family)
VGFTIMDQLGRREFLGVAAALAAAGVSCQDRSREAPSDRDGGPRLLQGKTCLVTGATSGIGAVTALELARLGATVVVAGRNAAKCAARVEAIQRQTGARVESVVADLASQDQVRRMASDVANRFPRLDVLVNNAGTYLFERTLTPERLEKTFAVNYLSHFLLTNLLREPLAASPSARVVCVSSAAHHDGRMDLENLQGERHYERLDAYSRSKLAILLFTYELSRRLKGSQVTANALHPGVVATNLGSENGFVRGWLRVRVRNLVDRSMLSPEEGARTSIRLASSAELQGVTGRYLDQGRDVRSSQASYDEALALRLWELSEGLAGLHAWR